MKDLGIDFGLLIAYLVPGAVVATALERCAPALLPLYDSNAVESTLFAVVLSLISGMVVSLVRGTLVDPTFRLELRIGPVRKFKELSHYGPRTRIEVDYGALVHEGVLNAFKEAVQHEKRPYQFYGNTLIATLFWALSTPSLPCVLWLLLGGAWPLLYVGARRSHFMFMSALEALKTSSLSAPSGAPESSA